MCSLFGILDYRGGLTGKQKSIILSVLSTECEERGTDATGIAYNHDRHLSIYKRPKAAHLLRYYIPDSAKFIMGHTRFTTQGSEKKNFNNHPFMGTVKANKFALAHNGVISNDDKLQRSESLPKTRIQTDSYVAVQLIEKQKELSFKSLAQMAEKLNGSYAFTVLDSEDNLWIVKGDSPLCLYHFPKIGCYIYASTEPILKRMLITLGIENLKRERISVPTGEILRIDAKGKIKRHSFDYRGYFLYKPWSIGRTLLDADIEILNGDDMTEEDDIYLTELIAVSGYYGYSPDDIRFLREQGFTCEEIEEMIYEESKIK